MAAPGDIDAIRTALRPRLLGLAGYAAAATPPPPRHHIWRGEWAADTDYEKDDVVYLATTPGGSVLTYMAREDHTAIAGGPPVPDGTDQWHEISPGYLMTDGSRPYVLAPSHTPLEGTLHWDDASGIDRLVMDVSGDAGIVQTPVGGVNVRVKNSSGNLIAAGAPVYISSADGASNLLLVDVLDLTGLGINDTVALGVTMQEIADGAEGWVCCRGYVGGLDLSSYADGLQLYVNGLGTMSGATPERGCGARIRMGAVISAANPGSMWVEPDWRPDLDDLANVSIGDYAAKAHFDVTMWLPTPDGEPCDAWRDVPASRWPAVQVTDGYDVTAKDVVVLCLANGADLDVNLPDIVDTLLDARNRWVRIKKTSGAYKVIVNAYSGQTINGDASVALYKVGEVLDLQAVSFSGDTRWEIQ